MQSVRSIVKRRDAIDNAEFDELLAEFAVVLSDGTDPEEALTEVFGLEPDYAFDAELWGVIEASVIR